MTGVFNRSVLASDLPGIIAGSEGGMVAIYAIDLDHFKAANDRFGHPVGDALLKQVAGRLTALAGPTGLVVGWEATNSSSSNLARDPAMRRHRWRSGSWRGSVPPIAWRAMRS